MKFFDYLMIFFLAASVAVLYFLLQACVNEIKSLKGKIRDMDVSLEVRCATVHNAVVNDQINTNMNISDIKTRLDRMDCDIIKMANDVSRLKIEERKNKDMSVFDGAKGGTNEQRESD